MKYTLSRLMLGTALMAFALPAESASPQAAPQYLGDSGRVTPVHKKDAEGSILIDSFTGRIVTPTDELPEWAYGLAMAQLAERHAYYTQRLGQQYAKGHAVPELYAFEDLAWLGVALEDGQMLPDGTTLEAGDEYVLDADDEHRMEVLGTVLGIDRDAALMGADDGHIKGAIAEVAIAYDTARTDSEMEDFRQGQEAAAKEAQG